MTMPLLLHEMYARRGVVDVCFQILLLDLTRFLCKFGV